MSGASLVLLAGHRSSDPRDRGPMPLSDMPQGEAERNAARAADASRSGRRRASTADLG
jgi:hypothetical protein